jgi:hypothetical protein
VGAENGRRDSFVKIGGTEGSNLVSSSKQSVSRGISPSCIEKPAVAELRCGQAFSARAERLASRIGGALLFALAAYVVTSAGWGVWQCQGAEFSIRGLAVSVLAIPIMRYLARRKIVLADKLGSRALRADAMEKHYLRLVIASRGGQPRCSGCAWNVVVESLGSLAIVWFLVKEGREAWAGEECGCG